MSEERDQGASNTLVPARTVRIALWVAGMLAVEVLVVVLLVGLAGARGSAGVV